MGNGMFRPSILLVGPFPSTKNFRRALQPGSQKQLWEETPERCGEKNPKQFLVGGFNPFEKY